MSRSSSNCAQPWNTARWSYTLAIVPLGSPKVAANPAGETYWVQDCVAAVENILLAAANIELGGVWVGVYPRVRKMDAVREILGIPADVFHSACCILGIRRSRNRPPASTKRNGSTGRSTNRPGDMIINISTVWWIRF